jgi:hypothetical protein
MVTGSESAMTARSEVPDRLGVTLREVCEHLARIDTTPCSSGEHEAASWIAGRLGAAGVDDATVARAGAGPPRARDRLGQQLVQLADVPERELAQERARRRGRGQPAAHSRRVRPARSSSQSSMQSAPSSIAYTSAITLRPAFAAPGRSRRNRTIRTATRSIPNLCANVATSAIPASE